MTFFGGGGGSSQAQAGPSQSHTSQSTAVRSILMTGIMMCVLTLHAVETINAIVGNKKSGGNIGI
jgi:hypothetical protein